MSDLRAAADAALTDFIYEHGSDFDEALWPGMAALRAALALLAPSAELDVERLALAMLALHWTAFQYHDDDFRDLADDIAREYAVSEASPE